MFVFSYAGIVKGRILPNQLFKYRFFFVNDKLKVTIPVNSQKWFAF